MERRTGGEPEQPPAGSKPDQPLLARVRAIPEGFVAAYGDVSPGAPRATGAALSRADDPSLPWWRVVRADGSLAKGARQRAALEAEGVPFSGARVEMGVARWLVVVPGHTCRRRGSPAPAGAARRSGSAPLAHDRSPGGSSR